MNTDGEIAKEVRDEFDNSFDVPVSPADAWPILSDIRRIASSIPGVQLSDVVDERTYRGTMSVPLGPTGLTFASEVKLEEIDPVNHTARLRAQGAHASGRGGVNGTVSFRLEPANGGSRVSVHTDFVFSGEAARYGALDKVQTTAAQIMTQFAANLRAYVASRAGS